MAYGRRRSTSRRKGRRGNRSLSTRRIFNNKGSKAQASQIFALRRRINRVARICRPEIKTCTSIMNNYGLALDDSILPGTVNYARINVPVPPNGSYDHDRVGNKINLLPIKMFAGFQYVAVNNSNQSYYDPSLPSNGIQVRIIAVQTKVASDTAPELDDVLERVNFNSTIDSMMMLREPFKAGITTRMNILMDKRVTLTDTNNITSRRFTIVPKSRSMRWEDGVIYPKGMIYVYILQGGATSWFYPGQPEKVDANKAEVTLRMETPYTDA